MTFLNQHTKLPYLLVSLLYNDELLYILYQYADDMSSVLAKTNPSKLGAAVNPAVKIPAI